MFRVTINGNGPRSRRSDDRGSLELLSGTTGRPLKLRRTVTELVLFGEIRSSGPVTPARRICVPDVGLREGPGNRRPRRRSMTLIMNMLQPTL